jgi:hypothetical protein
MTHALTALDTAAGEEIARRRQKGRKRLTTGISLTVVPMLVARAFFEIVDLPVDGHGVDVVRGLCGTTALLAMIVGGVIAVRAATDFSLTRQIRKILEATSWIEYPARPVEARKHSVEVCLSDVYTHLEVVGSAKRIAAQVRRSRRIELARLTPAGTQLVARAVGSSDLFLAEDEPALSESSESTEGQFGDFVVALTLRGTRLVARRSPSVTRFWGSALAFVALFTIGIAVAAGAASPDPADAIRAPEAWDRDLAMFDVLKIICVSTASAAIWPLVGLARATYCNSRGARRDRAVRAWIRRLLGWWTAMLTTAALLAVSEPRASRSAPVIGIAIAAMAIVLALLALRGPRETSPVDRGGISRPVVG